MENFKDTISIYHVGNEADGTERIRITIRRRGKERALLYDGVMELEDFARLLSGIGECTIKTETVNKIYNK